MTAMEMLSKVTDARTGEVIPAHKFFTAASGEQILSIFAYQLDIIRIISPVLQLHGIVISLNLSRSVATLLLREDLLRDCVFSLRDCLRIEVSEDFFPTGSGPTDDPIFCALSSLAPVWLDDFGAGTTSWALLDAQEFEAVKLDRAFVVSMAGKPSGGAFIRSLTTLANDAGIIVIAEGIENPALEAFAFHQGVNACQGWLWPKLLPGALISAPLTRP